MIKTDDRQQWQQECNNNDHAAITADKEDDKRQHCKNITINL